MNNFINTLFGALSDDYRINVWTLPSKHGIWIKPTEDFPLNKDEDVYFGLGVVKTATLQTIKSSRAQAKHVDAITCFWADVDFGDGHTKRVPPDEATAGKLLRQSLHPSIGVHSGFGWHCYWLLEEPILITDDIDRQTAAANVQAWQAFLRREFSKEQFELDATHDLARILRIPGTFNHKRKDVKPVKIIHPDGDLNNVKRYDLKRLLSLCTNIKSVEFNYNNDLPNEKLVALLDNNPKFRETWFELRTDMKDTSPSAYDLSLATALAEALWTDEEIVAALIKWRQNHGHDTEKLKRQDYIVATLNKARSPAKTNIGSYECNELPTVASNPEKRIEYLEFISNKLELPVRRVIRQGTDDPQYSLLLRDEKDTEIGIGTGKDLLSPRKIKEFIFTTTGFVIPNQKADSNWDAFCRILYMASELLVDNEDNKSMCINDWIREYLEGNSYKTENWQSNMKQNIPFIKDNEICLRCDDFRNFITSTKKETWSRRQISAVLRRLGFKNQPMSFRLESGTKTLSYWTISRDKYCPPPI